ncbi:Guanine nucleotide-binding protein subunit beta-2-like 1, partial [Hondaea fermentalgiana]
TASHVAEAKEEAKVAKVAAMLVSAALQRNRPLVEVVACKLPHALVPVVVDKAMILQESWNSAISYRMADEVQFDFCEPERAIISHLLDQIQLKGSGKYLRKIYDAFISYDRDACDMAKEIAKRFKDQHDLKIWLNEEEVLRSADESVSQGIALSKVVLVLATEGYMDKVNRGDRREKCVRDFLDARENRADRIVVAALEPTMIDAVTQWKGQFQLALDKQSPDNLSTLSDEAITHLVGTIWSRIDFPEASSDLTPLMWSISYGLRPCSSEGYMKEKAESFTVGTRSWIIDELCDWYNKKQSAVFILVGDGGVGKSVIMAELCHRGGALETDEDVEKSKADESAEPRRKSSRVRSLWRRSKKERSPIFVAAYHFFRHDQVTTAAPKEALVSIAWQLCLSVPGFADALDSVNLGGIRDKPLADVFQTIIVYPANKLGPDQMRQVVVLDALDECSKSDDVLTKVIRTWKDVMPAWLSLVVSTRPEGEIQRGVTNNSLDSKVLELKDEQNFRDIEMHIEHLLCDMKDTVEQKDVASCARILSERSRGLFLWASFLPETLKRMHENKRGGVLTLQDISKEDAIPFGLGGMLKDYFERLHDNIGGHDAYQSLLNPVVAARDPLSVEQLAVILGKTKNETKKIIDNARNLLYQGGDGRVALIHKRMADWLVDVDQSGDLGVDVEDGHIALADFCGSSRDDVFSLRHAVFHLIKSGEHAEAFELLNDFAWVQSAISVGGDEAQRRATIGNLIRDCVELGIYFAPESDTPRFLSKAVHALSYDPNELASQVLARSGHDSTDHLALSLRTPDQAWLEPTRVTLAHPRDPLLHMLKEHAAFINSVAIQGDTIVSGSWYRTVRIWNATSGEEQHVLRGHSGHVWSVAIQGDTIVSGSSDKTVRIWNATSGEEQHLLKGHSGDVWSVAIQGDTIVSGSSDKTVRIWNATSGEEKHVLKGHSGPVYSVAIQGDTIVSGSSDKTVRIWNATSGE